MQPITSIQECNVAAQAIGIPDTAASETNDSSENGNPRPEGCYVFYDRLWLAINPVNKGNGAVSTRYPICKISG